MSRCLPCRIKSSQHHHHHQHRQQSLSIPNSISMLSSLGIINNNTNTNIPSGLNLSSPTGESPTPTSETTISSSEFILQSCGHWCSSSFLRFLLVLSCCLLACIYPIAMRFYLVYFSVLVPLIFAVLNYSLGQITPTQTSTNTTMNVITTTTIPLEQQTNNIDNRQNNVTTLMNNSTDIENEKLIQRSLSLKRKRDCTSEEFELQTPLMSNIVHDTDGTDDREQFLVSPSTTSSQSSAIHTYTDIQQHRHPMTGKQKYFSNTLYEKYSRNMLLR